MAKEKAFKTSFLKEKPFKVHKLADQCARVKVGQGFKPYQKNVWSQRLTQHLLTWHMAVLLTHRPVCTRLLHGLGLCVMCGPNSNVAAIPDVMLSKNCYWSCCSQAVPDLRSFAISKLSLLYLLPSLLQAGIAKCLHLLPSLQYLCSLLQHLFCRILKMQPW